MERKMVIFVYGTLRRGDCRANLLSGSRFLAEATTTPEYTLFDCGSFPAMVPVPAGCEVATGVEGELYEVRSSLLDNRLDQIEGVPWLYDRGLARLSRVSSEDPEISGLREAHTYLYQQPTRNLRHLGPLWTPR